MEIDRDPALEAIRVAGNDYGIPLKYYEISVDSLIDEHHDFKPMENEIFALTFLNDVRRPSATVGILDEFLPDKIYVRSEMRSMFEKLVKPYVIDAETRILVGSPGIGKSVLFLLAAFGRARIHTGQIVMYFRLARKEISIFVMRADKKDWTKVNVLVAHNIKVRKFGNLSQIDLALTEPTNLEDRAFFYMLDGPHHNAPLEQLLHNDYHALCTSGGFPAPSQEDMIAVSILVLSGWKKEALLSAVCKLGNVSETVAEEVYALCGGRIRLAMRALKDGGTDWVRNWYGVLLNTLDEDIFELAVKSWGSAGGTKSSDRLRTRFYDEHTQMNLMVVDSLYLMKMLTQKLAPGAFMQAYTLACNHKLNCASGCFYEEILHRWFESKVKPEGNYFSFLFGNADTSDITGFSRDEGIPAAESVANLRQLYANGQGQGVYWAPSTPNFPNIDAAILVGSVLHCLQYTVQSTHNFNADTFWTTFLQKVFNSRVLVIKVRVWFVTPVDITFGRVPAAYNTSSTEGRASVPVEFKVHQIDASKIDRLSVSASKFPFLRNEWNTFSFFGQ